MSIASVGQDEIVVNGEILRLRRAWQSYAEPDSAGGVALVGVASPDGELARLLGGRLADLDEFDRVQLAHVVAVCRGSPTLSAAGRRLFAASRRLRTVTNDADRLRKYLARFGLDWAAIAGSATS